MVSEDEDGKLGFKVNYHYMSQVKNANDANSAARARRLAQEAVTLSTSLPLSSSSSVFVRCDEERLDIMKVEKTTAFLFLWLIHLLRYTYKIPLEIAWSFNTFNKTSVDSFAYQWRKSLSNVSSEYVNESTKYRSKKRSRNTYPKQRLYIACHSFRAYYQRI